MIEWLTVTPLTGVIVCLLAAGGFLIVDALGLFRRRWVSRLIFCCIFACLFWFFLQFMGSMSA